MRQKLKHFADRIQLGTSLLLIALAAVDMIDKPARLVAILTLAAGCVGLGVSIGVLAERKRTQRKIESDGMNVKQPVE